MHAASNSVPIPQSSGMVTGLPQNHLVGTTEARRPDSGLTPQADGQQADTHNGLMLSNSARSTG
jgi:hypothetical protein